MVGLCKSGRLFVNWYLGQGKLDQRDLLHGCFPKCLQLLEGLRINL